MTGEKHGYEIRVKGQLAGYWAEWFEGWTIVQEADETVLTAPSADHVALHGALDKIRDLVLTLVSVRQMDIEPRERNIPKGENHQE